MPENGVEGVADEIDYQDADGKPTSPLHISGQSDRGQAARGSDQRHQRDRPISHLLKLDPRFRLQSPDRFQKSSGKRQRERRHETDQSAGRKEEDEQDDSNRSTLPGGLEFQ